jgi:hypothetical protein
LSFYIGQGLKYETQTYYPLHPPKVMGDPDEYEDQPEPTPFNEPLQEEVFAEEGEEQAAEEEEDA